MPNLNNPDDWNMSEHDRILSSMLGKVDLAIAEVRWEMAGAPLFAVEIELVRVLKILIPEAQFTEADIKSWASTISS